MSNCDCNQGRLPCTCKSEPVPAGFSSGRDEDNQVLLDKRDLFDAVRGALAEQMYGVVASDEVLGMATDAATEALKDLVAKGAVPPAGDVEVLASLGLTLAVLNEAFNAQDSTERLANMDVPRVMRSAFKDFERVKTEATRLTAERDGLLAQLAQQKEISKAYIASDGERSLSEHALRAELTKARELNEHLSIALGELDSTLRVVAVAGSKTTLPSLRALAKRSLNIAHGLLSDQSAPAAKCDHARKHHEHFGTRLRCSDCGEACGPAAKGGE